MEPAYTAMWGGGGTGGELWSKGKAVGKHFVFRAEKEQCGPRCQFVVVRRGRGGWRLPSGAVSVPG